MDDDGQWKQYRDVTDPTTASPADIEYNQRLAEDKAAYAAFWRAETKGPGGKPISGNYTSILMSLRRKEINMNTTALGEHGFWKEIYSFCSAVC
ncbi:MAG: hypothetical protein CM15mV42_1200 [uncultured marine virus]|nr:MAG: hypothetical protein CM15mV42_1200 [uncultured marine virus]